MATPCIRRLRASIASSLRTLGIAPLVLPLLLAGCGRGSYEERLEATVQAVRTGKPAVGEAAEPPAAPADGAAPAEPAADEAAEAAQRAAAATNASGQGVVGRTILAPTDAFP